MGYENAGKVYPTANGNKQFDTSQTTFTMTPAKTAAHTIRVTRIIVWIKTDAAQSITFQDSNGTPVVICKVPASPGADTRWDFDFGPNGAPLTLGKDLVASFSAAGLAGHMEWYGFEEFGLN
jgi:hypothetical protein